MPSATATVAEVERLLDHGDVLGALDEARATVEVEPHNVDAHELLIDILMNLGLGLTAQEAYIQLATDWTGDPDALYLLGRAALSADDARTAYDAALDLDVDHARSWMGLGAVHRAEGELVEATVAYGRALELDITLAEAWSGLGASHIALGQLDQAVSVARRAVVAVPEDPEAYLALAAFQPDSAEDYLRKGCAAVPDEARLHGALGSTLLAKGDLAGARDSFAAALAIYPANAQLRLEMQMVDERERGVIDAQGQAALSTARQAASRGAAAVTVDDLEALEARYPRSLMVLLALGHAQAETGALVDAQATLERAQVLAPDHSDVQATLGLLKLSSGDAEGAVPLLESARNQRHTDVSLWLAHAMAIGSSKGRSAGIDALYEVAERFPLDGRPTMSLAAQLDEADRTEEAYQLLKAAVDRYPEPSLVVALAAAARDTGRQEEAARLLKQVSAITGYEGLSTAADRLGAP